jgi:hypothetical protein
MAAAGGMIPGISAVQANPFMPEMRHPFFRRVEEATTAKNDAETLGGRVELAAELAGPATGLVKAAPSIARGAVSMAKSAIEPVARGLASDTPLLTQLRRVAAKKLLRSVLDGVKTSPNAGGTLSKVKPEDPIAVAVREAIDEARSVAPGGVELPPQAALPPGYTPRSMVPAPPAAQPSPVAPQGRLVPGSRPTVEDQIAESLASMRKPMPPARITTPPPAELPPGYSPRTSAPKPRMAKAEGPTAPPRRATEPPPQPTTRAYFLKSPDEMLAAKIRPEPVTPSGSISVDDLPASWQSRVGQDLFPTTGSEAKAMTDALRLEIKERGMTIGQALVAVSKNKDIPTKLRAQIIRSLSGGAS